MDKIKTVLLVSAIVIYFGLLFHSFHQNDKIINEIDGQKIIETDEYPPGQKFYHTKWSYSHKEKFNKALINGSEWTIYTDKSSGKRFHASSIKIKYDDQSRCEVVFRKRTTFSKEYFIPTMIFMPCYFFTPMNKYQEYRITIVAPNPIELHKRMYPQAAYESLIKVIDN